MPQLRLSGLTETWLLKACGDLHWRLLADLAGLDAPDFRDDRGAPPHAAFCALAEDDLRLELFSEHDRLRIVSDLAQVSASRFVSRHRLWRGWIAAS